MGLITTQYDPTVCQCCGHSPADLCVCNAYPEWHLTEHGEAFCGYHKQEAYLVTERKVIALGAPRPEVIHDRFRNFRNTQ